ncbi:Glycosyl transferase family 2 [Spirosomataceae bacterium TFI 002]|nr:Glycosyl transferase family 2 [Spirosomataceae bacterium TFI 002]
MDSEGQGLDMLFTNNESLLNELNKNEFTNYKLQKPLVSICLITYNHARFLKISLDSIFSQKTDFDFEVIIGDDCSQDGTQEIIKPYLEQFPDKVKCFFHPKNLSKTYTQFTPGKLNFVHGLYNCSGKYVVHVEGDDYFTSELKLQTQVDFMESNPTYAACFHNSLMKFEDGSSQIDYLINPPDQKSVITAEDLLAEREMWFMATAAVMFKREVVNHLADWFGRSKSGDIPLYVLLSQIGPIGYIPKEMSVYRRHDAGMSYTDNRHHADFVLNRMFMYKHLNRQTKKKYNHLIKPIQAEFYEFLAESDRYQHSTFNRMKFMIRSMWMGGTGGELKDKLEKMFSPADLLKLKRILNKLKIIG